MPLAAMQPPPNLTEDEKAAPPNLPEGMGLEITCEAIVFRS